MFFTFHIFVYFNFSSPHQIRMKEEKEILEHFAGVVSHSLIIIVYFPFIHLRTFF